MNNLNIKHNWNVKKQTLLKNFAELREEDLILQDGKEEELIERVRTRFGLSYYETRKLFASLESI